MTATSTEPNAMEAAQRDPGDPGDPGGQGTLPMQQHSSRWAALSVGVQFSKAVLLFGSQVILARLISPGEFGIIAMASPLLNFVAIFGDLGLSHAIVQRAAPKQLELSLLFWISLASGLAIALIVALLAWPVSLLFGEPRLQFVLVVLGGTLVISSFSSQQVAMMFRHMRAGPLALIDIAPVCANVATSTVAALLGCSYWSLVIGQLAHALTAAGLAWTLSDWRPSWPDRRMLAERDGAVAMLAFGSHVTGYNVINFLATNLDNILLGLWFGDVAVGLYDRGFKLVLMSYWQLAIPISRIAQSLLARLLDQEAVYRGSFVRMLEGMMLVVVPGLVCLALMAELAVAAIFGPGWALTAPVVRWLSVGSILAPLGTSATWLFVSQARTRSMFRYGVLSTGSVILSLFAGLPWGTAGVAAGYAVFSVFTHGVVIFGATRQGPVSLRDVVSACAPTLAAAALAALPIHACRVGLEASAVPPLAILAAGIACAYAATGLALLCFPAGRQVLRNVMAFRSMLRRRRPADAGPAVA